MAVEPIVSKTEKIRVTLTEQFEDVDDDDVDGGFEQSVEINMDDPEVQSALHAALQNDSELAGEIKAKAPEQSSVLSKIKIGTGVKTIPRVPPVIVLKPVPETGSVGGSEGSAVSAVIDKSRYEETSLETGGGPVSMIVAITQRLLNSQLQIQQLLNPELLVMLAQNDDGEMISSQMKDPKLELDVDQNPSGSPSRILYHAYFGKGGSWNMINDSGSFERMATDDWEFVFETTLTLQPIDKASEEYKKAKSGFKRNGNYNIHRLMIDFASESTVGPRKDLSRFGGRAISDGDFGKFSDMIINWLKETHDLALAYSLEGMDAEVEPTFAPTSQRLQCYPHKNSRGDIVEGVDVGDNNLLLYVSMTQNKQFPKNGILPYSGNWCHLNDIPATMAIGRTVFFDSFLIPKLSEINKATFIKATGARTEYKFFKYSYGFSWSTSIAGLTESYFNWSRNGNTWKWSKSTEQKKKDGVRGFDSEAKITTSIDNKITIPVNSNDVVIDCKTKVVLFQQAKGFGIKQNGSVTVEQHGQLIINLKSVTGGKLELAIRKNDFNITKKTDKSFLQPQKNMDNLANSLRSNLAKGDLERKIGKIGERLTTVDTFILPGGQDFILEDATFNDEQDLLVQVGYND